MPKLLTLVRIAASCSALLAAILLSSGCLGLPTLEITPTTVPTTMLPTAAATGTPMTIKITGDVYVRDDQDSVIGWLYKSDRVQATCSDDWCQILSGIYRGYRFWRGCSSDNPDFKNCRGRQER